ncbi:hypothetical protein [Porphyromonas gingivicanis]|uniref:hypothetical protein n=1 Tax=Porphyromonas gingivicanis TaxID=266762 RepID=UPI001377184C|nr:hypothetical protein [Porphyromonas gingivicanis]
MGKVTRYRSVLCYAKHCVIEHQHRRRGKVHDRRNPLRLPSFTSPLPIDESTNDLVTELLHKSTSSALYTPMQTTATFRKFLSLSTTYPPSAPQCPFLE